MSVSALAAAVVFLLLPFGHGLSFVIRAADMNGTARRIADRGAIAERERMITIPTARGPMTARVYEPARTSRRVSLLVSGLHPSGIDEPRLKRLARELARSDVTIVTPDIPELTQLDITPAITDTIEQAALWLASRSGLASASRIGLMGISFSGGLSIVAAGRTSLSDAEQDHRHAVIVRRSRVPVGVPPIASARRRVRRQVDLVRRIWFLAGAQVPKHPGQIVVRAEREHIVDMVAERGPARRDD